MSYEGLTGSMKSFLKTDWAPRYWSTTCCRVMVKIRLNMVSILVWAFSILCFHFYQQKVSVKKNDSRKQEIKERKFENKKRIQKKL